MAAAAFRTPVVDRMASHEVFNRAMDWCKRCKCAKERPTWYPTRLIDLGNLKTRVESTSAQTVLTGGEDAFDNATIRIVEKNGGRDSFPEPGAGREKSHNNRYVTLSHCWGQHQPMVLKSDNFASLTAEGGVKLGDLPKTYREAMMFAARIEHVGWIWIDSLCIIQNDKDDWTHESSDMQRVYRESFLNISATASLHSDEGLYRETFSDSKRIPRTLWEDEINIKVDGISGFDSQPAARPDENAMARLAATRSPSGSSKLRWLPSICRLIRSTFSSSTVHASDTSRANDPETESDGPQHISEGIRRCILIDVSHWDDLVNKAPVNVRAWVLQERLLAPRVLHFSKAQVAWECREFEESEGYPTNIPMYILRQDRILTKPLYKGLKPDDHGAKLRAIRLQGRPDPCKHLIGRGLYELELWSRVVEDYSKLRLTMSNDKLVALSGIAELMAKDVIGSDHQPAVYYAGLWDKFLASQLLWKIEPVFRFSDRTFHHRSRRPRNPDRSFSCRAPSFSWASVDAEDGNGVACGEILDDSQLQIEVDSVFIKHKVHKNLYAEVERGHIMIRAKLRKIRLYQEGKGRYFWHLLDRSAVCDPKNPQHRRELDEEEHRNVYLDCPADDHDRYEILRPSDNLYCVPATKTGTADDGKGNGSKYLICLLLQHVAEDDDQIREFGREQRRGVYRRIGLTKLSEWADKRAYQYISKSLPSDINYPQRHHEYGTKGKGRSLICII